MEETGVFLMRFTKKATPAVVEFVRNQLTSTGLIIINEERRPSSSATTTAAATGAFPPSDNDPHNIVCVAITATRAVLEEEAEHHSYMKPTTDGILDAFTVASRRRFVRIDHPDFFCLSERAQLLLERLDYIRVAGDGVDAEIVDAMEALDIEFDRGCQVTLRHVLEDNNLVDVITPLHDPVDRETLLWKTFSMSCGSNNGSGGDYTSSLFSPVEQLCAYYGSEVALCVVGACLPFHVPCHDALRCASIVVALLPASDAFTFRFAP